MVVNLCMPSEVRRGQQYFADTMSVVLLRGFLLYTLFAYFFGMPSLHLFPFLMLFKGVARIY